MRDPFALRQPLGENAADAMPEGIAGCEHDRCVATAIEHRADIERHRPWTAAGAGIRKRQMPLSTEDRLSVGKRLSTCVRQPGKAIFADTDDGQPGIIHARSHSGWNERSQSAGG